jgi:DNA-binding transcriptional MerR regulator
VVNDFQSPPDIPEVDLTVAAVARRLGVAPATLRTWDRRYGLGPSHHVAGEHRRYNSLDLARITEMRRLVISGVPPAEAATTAKKHDGKISAAAVHQSNAIYDQTNAKVVEILLRAAHAFDFELVETMVRREIAAHGVIYTWSRTLIPLLTQIGLQWAKDGSGIEIEHLLSEVLKRVLSEPLNQITNPINARPVLLASVGEEFHTLALRALAAALAERNIDSQFLGARTPQVALNEVIRRLAPPAVFLWAQLSTNAAVEFIHEIPTIRPAPRIIIGGPGWLGLECSNATYCTDLEQASEEIARAVGV